MRKITVEVTYMVEIETDKEFGDDDEISEFVHEYLCNNDIEAIGDGGGFHIVNYGD